MNFGTKFAYQFFEHSKQKKEATMKTRNLLKKMNMFIAIILFQWMGSIYNAYADQNYLTKSEQYDLFEEFADICWETWCDKKFEILFYDFFCSFKMKKCSFKMDFYQYKTEHGIIKDSFVSACVVTVYSKEKLFKKNFRLSDDIYQQADRCVNAAYPKAVHYYESL